MIVQELINLLQWQDPNAEVHFAYNYGDHWRTQVAPSVASVEEGVVEFSDYHRMDKMVEEYEDQFDEETGEFRSDVRRVVVLG